MSCLLLFNSQNLILNLFNSILMTATFKTGLKENSFELHHLKILPMMRNFGYPNRNLESGTRRNCRVPDYPRYPTQP